MIASDLFTVKLNVTKEYIEVPKNTQRRHGEPRILYLAHLFL